MSIELQNAYAVSQQLHSAYSQADLYKIDAAVEAGLFYVVEEIPAYCPATDAQLPQGHCDVRGVFATREEADKFAEECDAYYDSMVYVRPEPPAPPVTGEPEIDDIPF